ncbi:MAG: hypothetical protein AB1894_17465 [Chloroflexota bacterium]
MAFSRFLSTVFYLLPLVAAVVAFLIDHTQVAAALRAAPGGGLLASLLPRVFFSQYLLNLQA